jgi:hypothetical protein
MVKSPFAINYYLSKYMVKNFEDGRLFGRKRYFASKNLFRPFIFMNNSTDNDIAIELLKDSLSAFCIGQISFDTDFCGRMYIDRYRISENRTLFELETLDPFVKERINSNQ